MYHWPHRIVVEKFDDTCGMWETFREYELPEVGSYPTEDYKEDYRFRRRDAFVSFHPSCNTYVNEDVPRCRIVEVVGDTRRLLWDDDTWLIDTLTPYVERTC